MHRFLGNVLPLVKRLANFTSGLTKSPDWALLPCLRAQRALQQQEHGGSFRDLSSVFAMILDISSAFPREKVSAIPAHEKELGLLEFFCGVNSFITC